jgi:uncharacterized membrane protein
MTIIFTCLSVAVLLVYVLNLIIMIKKSEKEVKIQNEEFADDHLQHKGIQQYFVNFFLKTKLLNMVLIFVGCAILIIGASICIAISTNWILAYS